MRGMARYLFSVALMLVAVGVVARWPGLAWAGGLVIGAAGWDIFLQTIERAARGSHD